MLESNIDTKFELSETVTKKEDYFFNNLRPKNFTEYIGQTRAKNHLQILIEAAKKRSESPDHILLYGPPGLGKTTLAHIIATELSSNLIVTSGPAIERSGDLAAILTNIEPNSALFIDEIHCLPKTIEEVLYPAMEDLAIDITLGKGPSAKILRIDLPPFLLIGATTKIGKLSNPFRDRFGSILRLDFYNFDEIAQILKRSANILNMKIDDKSLVILSKRSRLTPRIANRLLKRVRDLAEVKNIQIVNEDITHESLKILEIDDFGLDNTDRKLLEIIIEKYQGGPVGLKNISASLAEDSSNIEEVIEPYLLQTGFIKRTAQGRMATPKAYELFKLGFQEQKELL